jgi:hypothetical protein
MKITLGPAFFQFYCTLSHHCHPAVAKYKSHSTPLQILSIESFIIELIGLPAHHNSEEVSTKLLWHLVSISNKKCRKISIAHWWEWAIALDGRLLVPLGWLQVT